MTLPSFTGGITNPQASPSSSGSNPQATATADPVRTILIEDSPFDYRYEFQFNTHDCTILNGSTIVAAEISRFRATLDATPMENKLQFLLNYFKVNDGGIEAFRKHIDAKLKEIGGVSFSCQMIYIVGTRRMDTSGLGNIVYGYFFEAYPQLAEDLIANFAQGINRESQWVFQDMPDDITQRNTGGAIAAAVGYNASVAPWIVEQKAIEQGLW